MLVVLESASRAMLVLESASKVARVRFPEGSLMEDLQPPAQSMLKYLTFFLFISTDRRDLLDRRARRARF